MSLKNILDVSADGYGDGLMRGFASTGARTLSYTNALAKMVGFDAPFDEKKLSGLQQKLEETKEQILDKERTPERKEEVKKLKDEAQKAQSTLDILKSTTKSLGDTLTHPSEWTAQGVMENFSPSDPLNLAGLGAGGYLAKKGVNTLSKIGLGASGGALEGGVIGSAGEAANAYGKGDNGEEIEKAAIGGAFGGVMTGGVMGGGAAPFVKPTPKPEPKPSTKEGKPDNAKLFEVEELNADDIITVRKKAKEEPKPTEAQNIVNGVVEARAEALGKTKEELLGEKPLELKEHSVSGDVFIKSKEMDEALAKAQEHPRFEELMSMREEVNADDTRYSQKLESPRHINHYNNGDGWQTDVTGASYSKNYNADFSLTKQDIKNIRAGKLNDEILQKVNSDLSTLDNHPDYADARHTDPKYADKPKEMSFEDWDEATTLFQKADDSVGDIFIPSSRFSTVKDTQEKSYRPLKQTISLDGGDKIVGVQRDAPDVLVIRDKNGEYATVEKKNIDIKMAEDGTQIFSYKGIPDEINPNILYQHEGNGKKTADMSVGDWDEKRWRENRVQVSDDVFEQIGINKGGVFADYIKLAQKHPEYFSEPKEVKAFVDFVLEKPEYLFPATKKEYSMLVRTNGKDKGVVVDLELKGGKYRVRSAIVLNDGQLVTKLQKAKEAGEPILQFRHVNPKNGEHPSGGTVPLDTDSPLMDKTIPQTPQTLQGSIKGMFEKLGDKGVIHIFENSDLTTVFHESAHWLETTFTKDERVAFDETFGGVETGRARSEAFAEGFVKWAATGDAPNTTIKGVFEKTRAFLKDVLATLLNSNEARFKLTASQELFYRAVFGDEEAKAYFAKALEKRETVKRSGMTQNDVLYQTDRTDIKNLKAGKYGDVVLGGDTSSVVTPHRDPLNDGSLSESISQDNILYQTSANASEAFFGNDFTLIAPKGQGAVAFLLTKKEGHIKGAFTHSVLGDIDLAWGNEKAGLRHIFESRAAQWGEEKALRFLNNLADIVQDGILVVREGEKNRAELINPKSSAVISLVFNENDRHWLMSAYKDASNKNKFKEFESLGIYGENFKADKPFVIIAKDGTFSLSKSSYDKSISQDNILYQTSANASDAKQAKRLMPVYNFLSDFLRGQGKVGAVTKEALAKVHAEKLYEAMNRHLVYGGARADDVIDAFSAYKIEQSARGNKATDVYKHLEKLSKADRANLHLVLSGDAQLSALKPELENTYKALRNIIDQNAKELIELGELKADENIEHYLARTYKKDMQEANSLQNSLFASGGSVDHIKARRGKEAVMQMESELAKELEVGDSVATKNSDALFRVENITHGADGKAKITLHRDYTFAERSEMGEVRDAAFSVWFTLQKQNAQIARAKILQKIPTKMFADEDAAKAAGFEKVPDEATADRLKLYGSLGGKYISKYDKADLDYYLNISHSSGLAAKAFGLSNAWVKGVTLIKLNDTVKNATTHLNNFMSNVFVMSLRDPMAFATLGNPKKLKEAYKRIHELGLSDGEMPDIEAAMLKDFSEDAAKNTNLLLAIGTRATKEFFLAKGTTLGDAARTLYRFEDALFKAMVFAKKTSEGMSEADAVAYLRDGYVDYTKPLPPGVRMLDRGGVLPFVSFSVRSAPVAFRAIAENPVKFGLYVAALSASGLKPDEKEEALLPFLNLNGKSERVYNGVETI